MRIVKYFTYEVPFLQRIFFIRKKELNGIRKIQFARSAKYVLLHFLSIVDIQKPVLRQLLVVWP